MYAAESDFDSAFNQFASVVGPAAAHQNVGLLLLRGGNEERAVAHLSQAASLDPSLRTSHELLAAYEQGAGSESGLQLVSEERTLSGD